MGILIDKLQQLRNVFRSGTDRRRAALLLASLLVIVILTRLLQGFIREVVIDPLWYYFQFAGRTLESINQWAIWLAFLAFGVLLVISSLVRVRHSQTQGERAARGPTAKVAHLSGWIDLMEESDYFRWRMARHLGELSLKILARSTNLDPDQLRREIQAGELDMPPEVSDFLQSGLTPGSHSHSQTPRLGIRNPGRAWRGSSHYILQATVEFLEAELYYGHPSQHH
jgi:hypothetical protein